MSVFNIDEIKKLEKELSGRPEYELLLKLERLDYSIQLFDRNYEFLIQLINGLTSPKTDKLQFFYRPTSYIGDILFLEVSFRLHDFVASAKSLTDHSRIIYQKVHAKKNNIHIYNTKVNEMLVNNPIVQFIHKLREMCQHYKLPFIGAEWSVDSGQMTLFLSKKNLLSFNKWNSKAKEFLNDYKDKIDLSAIIQDYYKTIQAFHKWVKESYKELNRTELSVIEDYHKKINNLKLDYIKWEIEEALKSPEESKIKNLKFALAGSLTTKNKLQLIKFEENDKGWIKKSLEIIQTKITLPENLIAKIFETIGK